jgi:hypothetical protein
MTEFDPNVWSGRALQEDFIELADVRSCIDRNHLLWRTRGFNISELIRKVALSVVAEKSTLGDHVITADLQPMSAAPLDGTPIRLFISAGSAVASFWTEERCQKTFGAGCYRAGWYLLDDDTIELDYPFGWEPLVHGHACFENDTVSPTISWS